MEISDKNEYLLFRNTLRKMGVWNEFVKEKKKGILFISGKLLVSENELMDILIKKGNYMGQYPGRLLNSFPNPGISFLWDRTKDADFWVCVWQKIKSNRLLQYIQRIDVKQRGMTYYW